LTCTGVSFAHGSNDGQKGMGLIMLILIGILPGTYALNLHANSAEVELMGAACQRVGAVCNRQAGGARVELGGARDELTSFLRTRQASDRTAVALATLSGH